MGNGWKSAAVCGLAIVGMFAFTSDADAFWGRRNRCCGQQYNHGCSSAQHVGYASAGGCCDSTPVVETACCDSAPVVETASCCGSAPVHHVGYASSGCCGGGRVGHHRRHVGYGGGCCGGGGHSGTYSAPVYAQPSGGCTNCQAPW